uniref:ankyrin repeat domain-containing protein, chloroplastic n=1 Tax=Erigeron canadensis TaxID=72917 RepID=UPI001CB93A89|nr:ankyrin repeat domain-containing protein, chloroplastic [Erigeron canadensis]
MSILNHHSATTLFSHLSITPTSSKTPQNHSHPSFFFFQIKSPPPPLHSFTLHCHNPQQQLQLFEEDDDEEEQVLGDCLVFEEGIFQEDHHHHHHPPIQQHFQNKVVKSEDLIPPKWKDVQAEINITKKERRKMAQEMEFGSKLQKKKQGLKPIPIGYSSHKEYKAAKLRELNPVVLDNPDTLLVESDNNDNEDESEIENEGGVSSSSSRVVPRNPKMAVYGRSLDDISRFLNSGLYDPEAAKDPQGARKLFTKDEKVLMNRRVPDLEAVTSRKWQPLHTLAASGEFYLVDNLMKFSGDINVPNHEGLTAIHKAILGKKQAICNYLLRNSANPFVRDKEGATLMHYAVRTASTQMIKVLLLYNVDINLQDNDGWTPLHLAVQARRTDLVRLLLIKKADKTLKNQDGLSPLDLCLYSGRDTRTYELIRLLKLPPKPRKYAQLME